MSEHQEFWRAEEDDLGFQVRRCDRAFDRALNIALAREGASSGPLQFLRALWKRDGATQRRLTRLLDVSAPTTAIAVSGMVATGLVSRKRDGVDRRNVNVFLTARGRALKARLMPAVARINATASADVSENDLRTCLRVMKHMTQNLSAEIARSLPRVEETQAPARAVAPVTADQSNLGRERWTN